MVSRSIEFHMTNRIVGRLEEYGVDRYGYRLYEQTDLGTVTDVVATGDPAEQCTFRIHDHTVTVYGTGDVEVHLPS